jgi:two-component system, chemotaxis family, protein-glutamate methylesterase/glutaminase
MAGKPERVVAVAASAGGVEALRGFVGALDEDIPASILVVMHVPAYGGSVLPRILSRSGPLPAEHPADGEELRPGRIYVAPPDRHLLIHHGRLRLSSGPRQNGHRPGANPLFRSAALACGPRAVAVVLSGTLDDGAAGAVAVERRGGVVAVQDPAEATYAGMPQKAIEHTSNPHVLPVRELAALVRRLSEEPVREPELPMADVELLMETELLLGTDPLGDAGAGDASGYICPDCGGSLYAVRGGGANQLRCRVGHGWSPDGLLEQQTHALENALFTAMRSLKERAELSRRMAGPAEERGRHISAARFTEAGRTAGQRA